MEAGVGSEGFAKEHTQAGMTGPPQISEFVGKRRNTMEAGVGSEGFAKEHTQAGMTGPPQISEFVGKRRNT
ncbi:hypothetical protein KKH43_02640, partial [Patescibacteria group bacterium]|nr:hypothetical protein [Patescibacteria group bacterium]